MNTDSQPAAQRAALLSRSREKLVQREVLDQERAQWGHISAAAASIARLNAGNDNEVTEYCTSLTFEAVNRQRDLIVSIASLDTERELLERAIRLGDLGGSWQDIRDSQTGI